MRMKILILVGLAVTFGVACNWYDTVSYSFGGSTWNLACGTEYLGGPVRKMGVCRADAIVNGKPTCTSSSPALNGTYKQFGLTDAMNCALNLSGQPFSPAKCAPADFTLWDMNGPAGMGNGQKGPLPAGGLPSCPTP